MKYPDGTTDEVEVKVTVVDNRTDAEKYEAQGQDITVDKDSKANASDAIANKKDLPKDTEYDWKTPIDTSKAGEQTGTVVVKYPDGTTDEVEVKVTVVDNRTDAEKYEAEGGTVNKPYGETATAEEIVAVVTTDAPKEKVQSIEVTGTIPTEGTNKNVSVVVTYADGSNDIVMVVVNYGNASDTYAPIGQTITVDKGSQPNAADGIANKSELPKNTTYGWAEPVDTTTAGKKTGTIIVTYPDNSTDRVTVDIIVNDTKTDAEKYDPQTKPEVIKPGEKPDLTDNVVNRDELPEGTIIQDVTPDGAINIQKPGEYTGTLEITYPDGSKETVEVQVIVKPNENQDTNSDKNNHNNTTTDKNNHNNATSDKTTGAGNNAGKQNGTTAKKAPKTGDTANIAAYASALAASTVALLGVTFSKKRKKEEDDVL